MRQRAVVAVLLSAPALLHAGEPALTATIDGEPTTVEQSWALLDDRAPVAGDVVRVGQGELRLPVGPGERRLELVSVEGRLAQRLDGRDWPIEASVEPRSSSTPRLAGLSAEERKHLRRVTVNASDDATLALLEDLDLARCLLELEDGGLVETPLPGVDPGYSNHRAFPRLPAGTRHVSLKLSRIAGQDEFDFSALTRLERLETLHLELHNAKPLELAPLGSLSGLRALRLGATACDPEGLACLARLPALETLDLAATPLAELGPFAAAPALTRLSVSWTHVRSLAPLSRLRRLIRLDLDRSDVRSLAPLAALPELRVLRASVARVESLPSAGFTGLRELNVMATVLPASQVAAFRAAHPACKVKHGFLDCLREATQGADRVRVRRGLQLALDEEGGLRAGPLSRGVVRELTGAEAREFFRRFAVLEEPSPESLDAAVERRMRRWDANGDGVIELAEVSEHFRSDLPFDDAGRVDRAALEREVRREFLTSSCRCLAPFTFELCRGERVLATLGMHHGELVTWSECWPGGAVLSPAVGAWLVSLTAPEPQAKGLSEPDSRGR